ncbi:gluconate 2-dehydrogenase subunit 3 family protein [Niabella terrae]
MNRRKAIKAIIATGTLVVGGVSGYELIRQNRRPDSDYLNVQKAVIADLAELIIPRTDTPGAKDARVEDYIIQTVARDLRRRDANNFIDGLKSLNRQTKRKYSKTFNECSLAQQTLLLSEIQDDFHAGDSLLSKADRKIRGATFYETLKRLTVIGYCTSEPGATKGMAFVHIPINYLSCIPLEPGQKCWATK